MKPGFTSLTVIPYSPRPVASDFVSVRSAPFAVECGMRVQPPLYPSGPLMWMMRPQPAAIIAGTKALARYQEAVSCWLRKKCQSSFVVSKKVLCRRRAALLTYMSTRPKVASARRCISSTVVSSPAAPMTTRVFAPKAWASCSTLRASASLVRLLMITFAPRAANSRMMARPMFRPEPVTRIVLPVKSRSLSIAMHGPLCCVVGQRAHRHCRTRLHTGTLKLARPPRRHGLTPTAPDGVRIRLRPGTPLGADHVFDGAQWETRVSDSPMSTTLTARVLLARLPLPALDEFDNVAIGV